MHKLVEHEHKRQAHTSLMSLAFAILSALLVVFLAIRMMNYELRRDELLYVPPVRLLENWQLYEDFFYNHPPGSAWWFYGVRLLTGSDYLLLNGRIGVLAGWMLFAAAIGLVSFALTRSSLISWCIVALSLLNELFLTQTGMTATNNFLPLPFSFLGLGLFILGTRPDRVRPVLIALAGVCLSIAVVFKLSAIAFIPPVAVAAFLLPRSAPFRKRLGRVVLPLVLGGLAGGLPIIGYLLSDPSRFLAHIVGYHRGPHLNFWDTPAASGENVAMSLPAKFLLGYDIWLTGAIAISLVVVLTLVATAIQWRAIFGWFSWRPSVPMVLVLVSFLFSTLLSLVPTPSFPQYFAPPLVCLPLALAILYSELDGDARKQVRPAFIAATIIVLAIGAPRLIQYAGVALHPERWLVTRVHADGVAIAERLASADLDGKIATLSPIYPLEGGLAVYAELVTGPFAYRTGDITPPDLARYYRMTSPETVDALLEADPPAALLLGFDATLEEPLLAYARRNGYERLENFQIEDRYGTGILYVRGMQ